MDLCESESHTSNVRDNIVIDLELDLTTHDLILSNFSFAVTQDKQTEITQRLKIKLLMFKGEWIHNINYGIDYYGQVFVKGIDLEDIDDTFRTEISNEQGVVDLISYSSSFNSSTRKLDVQAKVLTDSGEIINLSFAI